MTNKQNIYERLMAGLADNSMHRAKMYGLLERAANESSKFHQDNTISLKREILEDAVEEYCAMPIMLGDIAAKIEQQEISEMYKQSQGLRLMQMWAKCGADKSLQDLYGSTEIEYVECIDSDCECGSFPLRNNKCQIKARLKDPNIEALFRYLIELNII